MKVWNSISQEIELISLKKFKLHYKKTFARTILHLDSLQAVLGPFLVFEPFDGM